MVGRRVALKKLTISGEFVEVVRGVREVIHQRNERVRNDDDVVAVVVAGCVRKPPLAILREREIRSDHRSLPLCDHVIERLHEHRVCASGVHCFGEKKDDDNQ